ncbi:sensor histidine kinase [Sphingomonas glacialis]|uniref:histidine kinase n=1 Tax=Sphingomonas glacialis TaxID=658225 RepID=A0A502FVF4_9SPHN|nr:CHASE3 domain-containing protein [Sphingomonas glacialis]TPG53076.1 histidine kinase [Sphingomonas glacialis]
MFKRFPLGFGVSEGRMGRFLVACMAMGFAALVAAGLAAAWSTAQNESHTRDVNHTYEVELAIGRARTLIEQSETARRGYVLTADPFYLYTYRKAMAQLPAKLERIATLTQDNPRQQRNIATLHALVDALAQQREQTIALTRNGNRERAVTLFQGESNARRMIILRAQSDAMVAEEQRLLAIRDAAQLASVRVFYATLAIAGLLLVLVAAATLLTVLRYTRDLATSRDALRDFAETLEEQVQERTADLTRANEEIQRFAYIVSHDLRSPLVNVMGFTAELESATTEIGALIDRAEATAPEIVTVDAWLAAREDLPEAIRFIRTSTQKMDRLINAILKLSREGRRVIAPQRLDVTAMVEAIAASLQTQIEARGATLVIDAPLPGLISDRLAIEQIFSNLIENAVKYLSPDRAGHIVVRGKTHGKRVTYEFEDNGRGIAPNDHQRVFDLFRRAGNQDQPGEGIGLAHVRALAYRLGGVIDVTSELGRGTTFRLNLPKIFVDPNTADTRETQR